MEKFWDRVKKKGAYIALMEDILPTPSAKNSKGKNITIERDSILDDKNIQAALQESCTVFNDVMAPQKHEKRMFLGEEDGKFLEPCPICYTGTIKRGTIPSFKMVVVGINPHRELAYWRLQRKWGELNDFHIPVGDINLKGKELKDDEGNNFWRISGDIKGDTKSSRYFQYAFFVHHALLSDSDQIYGTWKEFCKDKKSKEKARDAMLEAFFRNPILNVELIPFKSKKVESLTAHKRKKLMDSPKINYKNYLQDLVNFIDSYAENNAWIVFFYKTAYESFKEFLDGNVYNEHQFSVDGISKNENEIKANATFAKWKERRIAHLDFYTHGLSGKMIEDFLTSARNYK